MSDDARFRPLVDRAFPEPVHMTREETEEWGQEEPPRELINLGLCGGVGKSMVWNDAFGERCCPGCGGPESVGCWSEGSPSWRAYQRALTTKAAK